MRRPRAVRYARPTATRSTSIALIPTNGKTTPPSAIDEQVAPQNRRRAERPVGDALERQRNQPDDDHRVEDHRRQNGGFRRRQPHDVEHAELRKRQDEHRRNDREVFGDVIRDRERRQRPARHQQLLADLDDLDELGRVRVEVDHVPGFLRGGRAGVHRDADIGLRQRGRVVGAVAGHRDELPGGLFALDQRHLVFGRRLRQEVVDACLVRDRGRRERIVAGDHDGLDAHRAQRVEPLAHPALDDVLQVHDAERAHPLGHHERRAARARDALDDRLQFRRDDAAVAFDVGRNRLGRALPDFAAVEVDSGHPCLRRERNEPRVPVGELSAADAVLVFGQHDDRSSFRRFVRERRQLGRVRQLTLGDAGQRHELGRLPVPERDRPGLVEQQRVDVAGRLDGAARHGQDVVLDESVHAGNANRRNQGADRRRNQTHQQRNQHRNRHLRPGVVREGLQRHDDKQEDQREHGQQDVQRDFVRCPLALGTLDQRDHPVQKRVAGIGGDAHLDPVRDHARAAGHGGPVAARLANDRSRLAGDR